MKCQSADSSKNNESQFLSEKTILTVSEYSLKSNKDQPYDNQSKNSIFLIGQKLQSKFKILKITISNGF